ncbi:WXG100 family type VII secretion target [Streptomyces ovatisporus]|uniref:WXG100 family type VII secretion target n=1 Tax=Streptomyces ovatisporus TaxID=1128682 RepID=A0ABV9AA26_9ACTN
MSGYEVRKSGMSAEAGKLDRAGDDVGGIRKAVEDQMCYSQDALGGSDSGPAYDEFADAWQAEARTLEAALHELAGKVRVSGQNYQGADDDAVHGLRSAAGGGSAATVPAPSGGGLTTMPAPAAHHPGISTGPAPGEPPSSLADFD